MNKMRSIQLSKIYDLGEMLELTSVKLRAVQVFLSSGLSEEIELRGLGAGAVSSLSLIHANPGISQNEVGRTIGIDRSTMVDVMHLLSRRGWISRRRCSDDRRRYALSVTKKGTEALHSIVAGVKEREKKMLEGYSPEDFERFLTLLGAMRQICIQNIENAELSVPDHEILRVV